MLSRQIYLSYISSTSFEVPLIVLQYFPRSYVEKLVRAASLKRSPPRSFHKLSPKTPMAKLSHLTVTIKDFVNLQLEKPASRYRHGKWMKKHRQWLVFNWLKLGGSALLGFYSRVTGFPAVHQLVLSWCNLLTSGRYYIRLP